MALKAYIEAQGVPLRGGAVTVREKNLLKPGQFSAAQNIVPRHPGFEKRKGIRALHTTADGTNQAMTLYQFNKTRVDEDFTLVQWSDADVHYATATPPTVTTGVFGTEIFSGTASGHKPAHWANLNDVMIYSNASDQHKLWPGLTSYVDKFLVVKGTTSLSTLVGMIEAGIEDYTNEVSDTSTSTVAVLDSLDTLANGDGLLICTPVPAKSFTFTVQAANGTASALSGKYWKNDNTWAALTISADGTQTGGNTTFGQSGTVTFTQPTDIQERYLYGKIGYWYMLGVSVALDAETEVSKVTYDADFASIKNMWNGVRQPAIKVLLEGSSTYESFASASVDLGGLAGAKKIYICSSDPIEGIYIDVGDTPNTEGSTAVTSLKYWNGNAWTSVGTVTDGTTGMANSGWITFPRQSAVQALQFESTAFIAYWYELIWDSTISADVIASFDLMPYFDIADLGTVGQSSTAWKERAVYSFTDKFQEYVYLTAANQPQVFNGNDFGIVEVGDGRPHKVVAMTKFYNDLLVFQEEKGTAGGCITLIQGYNPPTFGKLVLSTTLGTMNAKSVVVVENVYTTTATNEVLKTVAFFLSRYGVGYTDGKAIGVISDDIQNYFDPTKSECIRRGYEDQMWIALDPINHLLKLGLVSGSTATTPNVFPVYDLVDRVWYFDVVAQELACWANVGAGSGEVEIITIGGGVDDGLIYQTNYGTADVSTAIDSYITIEIPGSGFYVDLLWFLLQMKVQTAGNVTLYTYKNGILKDTLTLSQTAEVTSQEVRRHLLSLNVMDQHISLKIANSSTTESMYLMNVGTQLKIWERR